MDLIGKLQCNDTEITEIHLRAPSSSSWFSGSCLRPIYTTQSIIHVSMMETNITWKADPDIHHKIRRLNTTQACSYRVSLIDASAVALYEIGMLQEEFTNLIRFQSLVILLHEKLNSSFPRVSFHKLFINFDALVCILQSFRQCS